jgi:hypothetical protein
MDCQFAQAARADNQIQADPARIEKGTTEDP